MAEIHGWVTAKLLATALWQQSAPTAAATTAALQQLVGYNDGFNPPIAWRKGATSRTPDGVLFTVHARAFTTTHVFETDPAP
jgi:hypothetical protein